MPEACASDLFVGNFERRAFGFNFFLLSIYESVFRSTQKGDLVSELFFSAIFEKSKSVVF